MDSTVAQPACFQNVASETHNNAFIYVYICGSIYMMLRARVYPFCLMNSRTLYANAMQ